MCGIIGYVGKKEATPILLAGLSRLEYRGYDSAGLCVQGPTLAVVKQRGKVEELKKATSQRPVAGSLGIAHTRWATHGAPVSKNAHPHLDCTGTIAVVHNGIIENFAELKKELERQGHRFKSDTDTEVLAHLIEREYKGDLLKAVERALRSVIGTYGLVVISESEQRIIVARQGSPLVIGMGESEYFVASDVAAFLSHTRKVIYLNDGEIAEISSQGVHLRRAQKPVKEKIEEVVWDLEAIEKQGYSHFMLKEIKEQPSALRQGLAGRLMPGKTVPKLTLNISDASIKKVRRIILTACGTSWHAALVGKYILEKYARVPCEVDYASEFRYRESPLDSRELVIVISQSGETADTLAALRKSKKAGAHVLGVVNVVGSTIAREVDGGIFIHAGPEIGVASTKAFTSQILCLNLLTLYFGSLRGSLTKRHAREIAKALRDVPELIEKCFSEERRIRTIAQKVFDKEHAIFLGRGNLFPVALEGALKLKEISYIHAEGYPAAEMKHGPLALIDERMPVVFIVNTLDPIYEKVLSNIEEVRARGGRIVTVADKKTPELTRLSHHLIVVPSGHETVFPMIASVPLQLLAYHAAVLRGCDVDKPRNLAKSVTVE